MSQRSKKFERELAQHKLNFEIYINSFKPNVEEVKVQKFNDVALQNTVTSKSETVVTNEMITELEAEIKEHLENLKSRGLESHINYMPMR
ncbi:hypothetical protein A3Q56_02683 [Intoshia linei]|uniref:Uncharacterized protein n=1 Tax=Intoshia linei TaxID=1819745 RepID=A0A177B835_9BILA|nr:hypothetical protein A3Q56_02683 [Intoshia linei]